jgi:methionyl-tRNA synthetase
MPWGIDVPGDDEHVMYVWFDALINYISTLGWPEDEDNFKAYWPGIQFAGKDQVRQQAAMWQAMLLSAGLPNTKQIFIHGFLTVEGQKISKSLGNTIDPIKISKKYGTDVLRYFLLAKINPWEDSDFSWSNFHASYNADLANGLGNLVARVAKLAENFNLYYTPKRISLDTNISNYLKEFRFNDAIKIIWEWIKEADQKINKERPWELNNADAKKPLTELAESVFRIAFNLQPFLPQTAEKILSQFQGHIKSQQPLFPRI